VVVVINYFTSANFWFQGMMQAGKEVAPSINQLKMYASRLRTILFEC